MKANVRSLAAAILSAALTFGTFPVMANESDVPSAQTSEPSQTDSQTPSVQDSAASSNVPSQIDDENETPDSNSSSDSSNPSDSSGSSDSSVSSDGSDSSSSSKPSTVKPDDSTSHPQEMPNIDTGDETKDNSGSSKTGDEPKKPDTTEEDGSNEENKETASDFVDLRQPVYDQTKMQLTSEFKIVKKPTDLAFQLSWNPSGDASIDPKPVSITVNAGLITITPKITEKTTEDGATTYLYVFTADQMNVLQDNDTVTFVFDVLPGLEANNINTVSSVLIDKKDPNKTDPGSADFKYTTEEILKITVPAQWSSVNGSYDYKAKTWTLKLRAAVKPEKLTVFVSSTPTNFLSKDGVVVTVDGKTVTGSTVTEVKPASGSSTNSDPANSSDSSSDSNTTADYSNSTSKNGIEVALPAEAVAAMQANSTIDLTFKLNTANVTTASIEAEIDNGLKPITYETHDFKLVADPEAGHSYNGSNEWTTNFTLRCKPDKLVLTYEQVEGNQLASVKSVTLNGTVIKPDIKESTAGGHKVFTLTFPADEVAKMDNGSKVSVVFNITQPSSGTVNEKVKVTFDCGQITKDLSASFTVKAAAPTTTGGTNTAAQTGIYAAVAVFGLALIVMLGAYYYLHKNKKSSS